MKATNQTVQRSFNRSLVLQRVRKEGRISRVDLSRALGLEKSSISAITAELIDSGLLLATEQGEASVSGGRKPVFLELNGAFCCFLGIEIQPTRYRAVLIDLRGRVLHREGGALSTWETGFERAVGMVCARLDPVVRDWAARGVPLAALSVGIPGLVNPEEGTVALSVPHSLKDFDFKPLGNPWNVPGFIENDANCCAWATLLDDAGISGGDFLAILLEMQDRNPLIAQEAGVSLGFGLVLGGEVHYGRNFDAGEFRSLFWRSGNRSQTGIPDGDLEGIAHRPEVLEAYLGEVLLNLIPVCSLLAPERIILCGDAVGALPQVQSLLDGRLADTWLARPEYRGRFCVSSWVNEAVAVGAASRLLLSLFNSRSLSKNTKSPTLDWDQLLARFGKTAG